MQNKFQTSAGKCLTCGENVTFNPDNQTLDCPACSTQNKIDSRKGLFKHSLDETTKLTNHKNLDLANKSQSMQCINCGASIIMFGYQSSGTCPYCNTNMIAKADNISALAPDSIIPFKFGKNRASQIFKEKLKKKWLVSIKFKKSITSDDVKAYYFPSFVFDAEASTIYDGRLYRVVTKTNKDGSTETVRKYFSIGGRKETEHNNIEIEASTKISQFELSSIKPYRYQDACAYNPDYIYGYSLEQHSESISDSNKRAEIIMKNVIRKEILKDYKHDGVDYLNLTPTFYNKKYSYCILPMYRINFSHKNKKYSNVMNGQTGALSGKYPKSGLKITLLVLSILLIVGVPIFTVLLFILKTTLPPVTALPVFELVTLAFNLTEAPFSAVNTPIIAHFYICVNKTLSVHFPI